MTLGLPGHLARDSMSRALAHAGHCAAWVCLGIGALISLIGAVVNADPAGWAGAALCGAMALLLLLVARFDSVTFTVLYLVAGAGAVLAATVLVMDPAYGFESTNNVLLALPRVALILVGGAGVGTAIAITWGTLGYGLGLAATFLGAMIAGATWAPNLAAGMAFGIFLVVRIYDGVTRSSDQRRETGLHRASQQNRELAIRHDYELRATARLHDTALSHLVAIAAAGSGPVDERLREGIRRDLGLIVGRDWATEHAHFADEPGRNGAAARAGSPGSRPADAATQTAPTLEQTFTAAEHAGLELRVTGDLAVLGALGPGRAAALDQAAAQCVINVARHAGVGEAELAIGFAGGEVTVAVMDSGVGFDESEVGEDRIGLRTSVRARIEQEDGTVRVWSTKGIGTTVVLTVPEGGR
ncbi:sensor histidine kinase [Agromyces sp. Marseille-P2726]|uniref:sensor histidine kinase n=1 Tax=Agromyces sp. Marseille-P2726 TaxID=2709132 RepID=UPI00156FD3F1|nr:ATP-binding protein [Agromyces sp. Marseille-P2726]